MIRSIARFAVGNPVAVNLATLTLIFAGLLAYRSMPREVFPQFSLGTVRVSTLYPGAAPEDVERLLTLPLEEELDGVDGVKELSSTSQEGLSTITLELLSEADVRRVLDDVRAAVDRSQGELPDEAEDPWVQEVQSTFPVIAVFVYGNRSESELRTIAERHKRELEQISGVGRVVLSGNRAPRVWVEVDPEALGRHGLSLDAVGRAVSARLRNVPAGSLTTGAGDFLLRVDSGVQAAVDLEDLPVVARPDGSIVRLRDIARVSDTFERPITLARFNGEPCMHLQVNKREAGDVIEIAAAVQEYVARERELVPSGVAIGTNSDLSIYVRNRLRVMAESATLGGLLVLISLVVFLNLRVALITALGIPVSFLGGLLIASAIGISMNMMTMFALIVVLGMIVDDAIVVGENAYRLMEAGLTPMEAAIEGTVEVGKPVLATILTSIAAFLPILMIEGTTGNFLRPLPILVSLCLLASLVEALAVLPAHVAHWCGPGPGAGPENETAELPGHAPGAASGGAAPGGAGRWYGPLQRFYGRSLAVLVDWRYVTLAAVLFVGALLAGFATHRLPFHLFDDFESKIFYVNLRMPAGTSLEETQRLVADVEREIVGLPANELESVNSLAGISFDDAARFAVGQNLGQIWVELREDPGGGRRSTAAIIEDLRGRWREPPAGVVSLEIAQPQAGPTGRAIDISVRGPDRDELVAVAGELKDRLRELPGVRDVRDNAEPGKREVRLRLLDSARTLGFTEAGLGAELRAAFEGTRYGRVRRGRDDVEVIVKLPEELRDRRDVLAGLRVSGPGGVWVPLGAVAELSEKTGPAQITRQDGERSVRVIADVNKAESSAADVIAALTPETEALEAARPGVRIAFEGDQEETAEAFAGLLQSSLVALLLIYLILGTLFRSFAQPFVVMFAIPLAGIGVVVGHVIMDRDLSLMSLIGLLALAGIVVNDSLILVDFINVRRRAGAALRAALLEACSVRFRPVLLTSVTTMLGLLPLTFFASGQARFLQPMAISIFFGIGFATLLILVVVPCSYAVLEDGIELLRRPFRHRSDSPNSGGAGAAPLP